MKLLRKLLCVGLLATMLLPILSACAGEKDEPDSQPAAEDLTVVADQKSEYVLIYPAGATDAEMKEYRQFNSLMREKLSVFINLKSDAEVASVEGTKEILLGLTNRPESQSAYSRLETDQVGFYAIDGQISIVSNFDGGFILAAKEFLNRYVTEDQKLVVPSDLSVRIQGSIGYLYEEVSNTQDIDGDDPYVIEHEGSYYYCWSDGGVMVAKIDGLNNIVKDDGVRVFDRKQGGFENVWAPELHYIDGEWYIYVAMCEGTTDNAAHRMYCLKGTSQDPTDPFVLVGKVTDPTDKWAIDGTVFRYDGELYTVWSGWPGDTDGQQNLYIAHMSNPWTIDSERVLISSPTKSYERYDTNPSVNEGPAVLINGDTIIVVYSCNGSWGDNYSLSAVYCQGDLLMKSKGWTKLDKPLLTKGPKCYGPGHCSFTTAEDGSLWVVYHANIQAGTGWSGRSVRIQPVEWKDGLPYIGSTKLKVKLPHLSLTLGEVVEE
ncbi:MAG: glycoside hydrolase family 43 protein [Clostridia bacterium]|nr:glycoside hydrolase family 43 protein [Clostridia bacterium]MBQ8382215.1 glycoside hydrolase family 43 protein [Clostridia bacterium]